METPWRIHPRDTALQLDPCWKKKKHGKRHWAILEDYKDYIYDIYIYMHLFIYIIIDFFILHHVILN